jgi:hypothetical protein
MCRELVKHHLRASENSYGADIASTEARPALAGQVVGGELAHYSVELGDALMEPIESLG